MPDARRLPTSVFVLLGALVLAAGGAWWTAAAPTLAPSSPTPPGSASVGSASAGPVSRGAASAGPVSRGAASAGPVSRGAGPMESVVVIDIGNGQVLTYVSGRSTISEAPPRTEREAFERMVAEMKKRR